MAHEHTDYSLVAILRDDPDFNERLTKKTIEVKKDKANILKTARDYSEKYHEEITEGNLKSTKMIEEGKAKGKSEEEVMKDVYRGGFIPARQTPILNMLYFILRESEDIDRELYEFREKTNKKVGNIEDRDSEVLSDNFKSPEDMFTYLYGHINLATFKKLKKLKALTTSKNIDESTLAFRKCKELCEKYNIDYERIPCNVD